MIIYISTYPRSGNTWIRYKIEENYGIKSTEVYSNFSLEKIRGTYDKREPTDVKIHRNWIEWEKSNKNLIENSLMSWDYDPVFIENKTPINTWQFRVEGYGEKYALYRGVNAILKYPAIRAYLSDQKHLYIIKTHDYPFESYHPREKVLQVVRNPGASYWSYKNYLKELENLTVSMEDMIRGKVGFGSWKTYHEKYIRIEKTLGKKFLRILFEDLKTNELGILKSLSSFLERPMLTEELLPFEYYRKKQPELARKGEAFGWEENYSLRELLLLWELHKDTMAHYGYEIPDFSLAKKTGRKSQ